MVSETTGMSTSDLQQESSSPLIIPTSLTPGDVYYIAENSMVVCMSQAGASQLSPMLASPNYLPPTGSPSEASSSPVGISTSYIITGPVPSGYYTTSDSPYSTLYVNSGEEYLGGASSPMMCTPDGQCYSPAVDYVVLENGMMSPIDVINGSNMDYEYYGNTYQIPTSEFEQSISSEDSSNIVQDSANTNDPQSHAAAMQNGYAESVASENSLKQPRPNVKPRGIFYTNSQSTVPMKKANVRYHLNQSFRNGHWANNVIVMAKDREGALRDTQNEPEDLDEKGAVSLDIVLENFPEFSKIGVTNDELKSAIKDADNMVLIEDHFLTYKIMGRIVFSGMPTVCQDNLQNGERRFEFASSHIGEMFNAFVRSKVGEDDAKELDVRPDLNSVMITSRTFPLNKMETIFKIFGKCAYQSIHTPQADCCPDGLSLKNISLRKVPISDNVVTIEENGPTNNNDESPRNYYPPGEEEVPIEPEESVHVYSEPNIYPISTTHLIGPVANLSLSSHAGHLQPTWSPSPIFFNQPSALNMKLSGHRHVNSAATHSYRNGMGSRGNRPQTSGNHCKVPPLSAGIPLQQGQRMERSLPPRFQRGMLAQQSNYPPNGNNMVYLQEYHHTAGLSAGRPANPNYHVGDGFYNATTASGPFNDNSHGYVSNSGSNQRRGQHISNADNRPTPNEVNSCRNGVNSGSGRGGYSSGENRRGGRSNGYSGSGSSRGGRRGGHPSSGHFSDRYHHSSRYSDSTSANNKINNSEPPVAPSFGEKDFPSLPVSTEAIKSSSQSVSASSNNANAFTENEPVNVTVTVWGTVSKTAPKPGPGPTPIPISPSEIVASKNFSAPNSPAKNLAKETPDFDAATTAPLTNQNAWSHQNNTTSTSSKPCGEESASANNNSVTESAPISVTQQSYKCTSYADVLKSAAAQSNTQSSNASLPAEQDSNYSPDTAIVSANAGGGASCESFIIGQQSDSSSTVQVSVMNGGEAEHHRPAFPNSSRGSSSRGGSSRGGRGSGSSRGARK